MVLIFESILDMLRVNVAMLTTHQWCSFQSLWAIRCYQQDTFSSLIYRLMTLHFKLSDWIVAYLCINVQGLFLFKLRLNCFSPVLFTMLKRYGIYNYWTTVCRTYPFVHWYWSDEKPYIYVLWFEFTEKKIQVLILASHHAHLDDCR